MREYVQHIVLGTLLTIAASCMLAPGTLQAQRFQTVAGGNNCREEGLNGAAQLANSGYIACGSTFSTGTPMAPCGPVHAYVVKLDATGALVWSNYYPVGVMDSATDIVECANGDFVVCGTTNGVGAMRDMFVMRLDSNGNVLLAVTIDLGADEEVWDVLETTTGNFVVTNPGDIVLAGSTTAGAGTGYDAVIIRLNANLGLIWESQWGGPGSGNDFLKAATEATVGALPGIAADIVAVGGTNSSIPTLRGLNNGDILVLRVSGNTGLIGPAPQGQAAWGFDQPEEALTVTELRGVPIPGDIVVGGRTLTPMFPSINYEGFLLQLQPDPTLPQRADIMFGDNGIGYDAVNCVREDPFSPAGIMAAGQTANGGPPSLFFQNVFLHRFNAFTLLPAGVGTIYGGTNHDWGMSMGICTRISANETQGYFVAGTTQSPGLMINPDPAQLYMLKTDLGVPLLSSNCNENNFGWANTQSGFVSQTLAFPITLLTIPPRPQQITPVSLTTYNQLCYSNPAARGRDNGGNDGVSGVDDAADAASVLALQAAPNPAARGAALDIAFTMPADGKAVITVSDMMGREVYRTESAHAAGSARAQVATASWPAGNYVVRVAVGNRRAATRVVVQ